MPLDGSNGTRTGAGVSWLAAITAVLGEDNVGLYEMIKFQTIKAGKQVPSPEIIELAKKTYKDPIPQHDKEWQRVENKLGELFNKEGVIADRDEYYKQAQNMYRVGMVGQIEKDIKEQISGQMQY